MNIVQSLYARSRRKMRHLKDLYRLYALPIHLPFLQLSIH